MQLFFAYNYYLNLEKGLNLQTSRVMVERCANHPLSFFQHQCPQPLSLLSCGVSHCLFGVVVVTYVSKWPNTSHHFLSLIQHCYTLLMHPNILLTTSHHPPPPPKGCPQGCLNLDKTSPKLRMTTTLLFRLTKVSQVNQVGQGNVSKVYQDKVC